MTVGGGIAFAAFCLVLAAVAIWDNGGIALLIAILGLFYLVQVTD